jgi:hypothetical protein
MPTESELRDWLQGEGATLSTHRELDAGRIIRRSKRRRLPKQLGVGTVTTLAVAGIAVGGITGLKAFVPGSTTTSGASHSFDEGGIEQAPARDSGAAVPAQQVNRCGSPLVSVPANALGLVLTPHFPVSAPANGEPVEGTVTLTNTGISTVTGSTTGGAVITVSSNGTVLWHSSGPRIAPAKLVDLAPGQRMDFAASFTPVRCRASDDKPEGFPAGLPALTVGHYQVSALLEVNDGTESTVVGGEPIAIELH